MKQQPTVLTVKTFVDVGPLQMVVTWQTAQVALGPFGFTYNEKTKELAVPDTVAKVVLDTSIDFFVTIDKRLERFAFYEGLFVDCLSYDSAVIARFNQQNP